RPHFFGSLLARLSRPESHQAVAAAAGELRKAFDTEVDWWMVSVNRAQVPFAAAAAWINDDDRARVLAALRMLQRLPKRYEGEELKAAGEKLGPKLAAADDEIITHALFACAATGACAD